MVIGGQPERKKEIHGVRTVMRSISPEKQRRSTDSD